MVLFESAMPRARIHNAVEGVHKQLQYLLCLLL
jgi:hypothetical protein